MSLIELRQEINKVNHEIIRLISKRQKISDRIGAEKIEQGILVHDSRRVIEVLESVKKTAKEYDLSEEDVKQIFEILIHMSEKRQNELIKNEAKKFKWLRSE